jgi:predicted nucleic acid-binding protein
MPARVLDSFALIAYFRDEEGAETMENLLVTAGKKDTPLLMTDVNYAEVKYSVVKKDGAEAWHEPKRFFKDCRSIFTPQTELSPTPPPISKPASNLADAFAAALASERNAELVTWGP